MLLKGPQHAKHWARHFPHVKGRLRGKGENGACEAQTHAAPPRHIYYGCEGWEEQRGRRSDFVWGMLLLVSPHSLLFPSFHDKSYSHFPFLAPWNLLAEVGMPKATARFCLWSGRCVWQSRLQSDVLTFTSNFPHNSLGDTWLWKHMSRQSP